MKRYHLILALIAMLALAFGGVFLLIQASPNPTPFNPQIWQDVATMSWALVPFGLLLLLLALGRAVSYLYTPLRTYIEARSRYLAVEAQALIESTASQVALNDALMWQARHAAKAQRVGR